MSIDKNHHSQYDKPYDPTIKNSEHPRIAKQLGESGALFAQLRHAPGILSLSIPGNEDSVRLDTAARHSLSGVIQIAGGGINAELLTLIKAPGDEVFGLVHVMCRNPEGGPRSGYLITRYPYGERQPEHATVMGLLTSYEEVMVRAISQDAPHWEMSFVVDEHNDVYVSHLAMEGEAEALVPIDEFAHLPTESVPAWLPATEDIRQRLFPDTYFPTHLAAA